MEAAAAAAPVSSGPARRGWAGRGWEWAWASGGQRRAARRGRGALGVLACAATRAVLDGAPGVIVQCAQRAPEPVSAAAAASAWAGGAGRDRVGPGGGAHWRCPRRWRRTQRQAPRRRSRAPAAAASPEARARSRSCACGRGRGLEPKRERGRGRGRGRVRGDCGRRGQGLGRGMLEGSVDARGARSKRARGKLEAHSGQGWPPGAGRTEVSAASVSKRRSPPYPRELGLSEPALPGWGRKRGGKRGAHRHHRRVSGTAALSSTTSTCVESSIARCGRGRGGADRGGLPGVRDRQGGCHGLAAAEIRWIFDRHDENLVELLKAWRTPSGTLVNLAEIWRNFVNSAEIRWTFW